jgi:6-pyruvoyltetrahydropterin/6-carboxytetrahydropterin synthase
MYRIAKQFTFCMGHRLSLHPGACKNFHGHNYTVEVGVKSKTLNENGMIIDFGDLKTIVTTFLEGMDHALMVNETDTDLIESMKKFLPDLKTLETPFEPTAENMAKAIYDAVGGALKDLHNVDIDYVDVYETDTSRASYSED